jgi:hypothetical protein
MLPALFVFEVDDVFGVAVVNIEIRGLCLCLFLCCRLRICHCYPQCQIELSLFHCFGVWRCGPFRLANHPLLRTTRQAGEHAGKSRKVEPQLREGQRIAVGRQNAVFVIAVRGKEHGVVRVVIEGLIFPFHD